MSRKRIKKTTPTPAPKPTVLTKVKNTASTIKDKAANIGCEAAKAVVFPFAWTRMQMGLLPQRISTKIAEVKAAREVAECMDAALTVAAEDLKAVADKADLREAAATLRAQADKLEAIAKG